MQLYSLQKFVAAIFRCLRSGIVFNKNNTNNINDNTPADQSRSDTPTGRPSSQPPDSAVPTPPALWPHPLTMACRKRAEQMNSNVLYMRSVFIVPFSMLLCPRLCARKLGNNFFFLLFGL